VLILTLQRFGYDAQTNSRRKIATPVRVDQSLRLDVDDGEVEFELFAVVFHSGPSPNSGHYFTFATLSGGTEEGWFQLNDRTVSAASFQDVAQLCVRKSKFSSDSPYMLFFRRRGTAWDTPLSLAGLPGWLRSEVQAMNEKTLLDEEAAADRRFRAEQLAQQQRSQPPGGRAGNFSQSRFDGPEDGFGGGFGGGGPSFVC
jgi:Ubiquitin carboxyl-terminal hydrolase